MPKYLVEYTLAGHGRLIIQAEDALEAHDILILMADSDLAENCGMEVHSAGATEVTPDSDITGIREYRVIENGDEDILVVMPDGYRD